MNRTVAWLRLEGVAVLVLAVLLYARHGAGWMAFAALLLLPDVSMAGYLASPRRGALAYNLAHTYTAPLLLAAGAVLLAQSTPAAVALVWLAHIGLDRALGYGLKLPTGFHDTHLGRIGRRASAAAPAAVP